MPESDRLDAISTALAALACVLLVLALSGCQRTERSAYDIHGTMNGQPVRLVIDGEAKAVTTVDPEAMRQAAEAAGRAGGQLAAEAVKAAIPGADAVAKAVQAMMPATEKPGLGAEGSAALAGAGGLALLVLREMLAHRKTKQDEAEGWDEALRLAKALPPEKAKD